MVGPAPSRSGWRRLGPRTRARTVLAAGAVLIAVFSGLVAGGTPTGAQSGTGTSSWVGVGELLVVKLSPTGAVSATPYQHTMVTASGTGTVKVQVPMSASGMRLLAGSKPPVTNGVGQFTITPNGTATQNVRSDFAGKLPLTAKVSYQLNGQPTQASALAPTRHLLKKQYKSGTLKVTYVISNVTSQKTTVSFEGFNGAHITKTITDPIPMVAEVKLTFPSNATAINAPGASLAAGKKGVKATWTMALAPPLTGKSKSISYSVNLSQVKVPEATIEAKVLAPKSTPSGKVPQSVAAALAGVEGQPEQGLGGSPVSLGQVRSDTNRPHRSTSSKLESQKRALRHAHKTKRNASLGKIQPSLDQWASVQATNEQATVALGDPQRNGLRHVGRVQLNRIRAAQGAQLNRLHDTANQAIATLASEVASGSAQANTSVGAVLGGSMTELASSITSLRALVSGHVAHQSTAVAAADKLAMAANALGAVTNALGTVANQHATSATALDKLIEAVIADANAFPPEVQSTPEWIKLASDLAAAKAKADLVCSVAADIAQQVAAISTAVQRVERQAVKLKTVVRHGSTEAAGIQRKLINDVLPAERNLESTVAHVSGKVKNFQAEVAAAQSRIGQATNSAQATIGQVTSSVHANVNAFGQKASADLAAGKQKAQAAVHKAVGSVQAALNKANSDYAQLLAITQIGQANQLPGGNATGANVQNGAYVFRISGTG